MSDSKLTDMGEALKRKVPVDYTDPPNSAVKPGYKSTEFYLYAAAMVIGAILASGIFSPANPDHAMILRVLGLAGSILSVLGYGVPRQFGKTNAATVAGDVVIARIEAASESAKVPGVDRD